MKLTAYGTSLQNVKYKSNMRRISELTKAVEEAYFKNAVLIVIRIPENMKRKRLFKED